MARRGRATRMVAPRTRRGRWAAGVLAGSWLAMGAFFALVASGQRGGDTFFSNAWLSGAILTAAALGLAAGVLGVLAATRDGDRSVSVAAAILFGLLVVLVGVGEVAFPH